VDMDISEPNPDKVFRTVEPMSVAPVKRPMGEVPATPSVKIVA